MFDCVIGGDCYTDWSLGVCDTAIGNLSTCGDTADPSDDVEVREIGLQITDNNIISNGIAGEENGDI